MNGYELVRLQPNQLKKTGDTMTGDLKMSANIVPTTNNARDLGSPSLAFRKVYGSATSADKLTTARGFSINGIRKTFNGEGDISWTLAEIGAASTNHNQASNTITAMTGYTKGNASSAITTSDTLNSAIGKLENKVDSKANSTHTHNYAGSNTAGGAANSAVKLQTPRNINGVAFDGTKDITIADNTKLPLTGGTMTGNLTMGNSSKVIGNVQGNADTATRLQNARNITIGNATQSFNGSASISYTLTQVGAVQFEYSSDPVVNGSRIPTIFADGAEWLMTRSGGIVPHRNEGGYLGVPTRKFYDVHTLHINGFHVGGHSNNQRWELIPLVNNQGVMEIGKYVDFHNSKASTSDYTYRLQNDGSTLLCSGTLSQMSDRNLKENIEYLSEVDVIGLNSKIKKQTFIDFIREFRFATYNYKGAKENNFGFIAQDIQDSHIGKYMLRECNIVDFDPITKEKIGEKECLAFDITAYTSIVARALQEEVLLRDKQIESLEEKIKLLEKKIDTLVS